MGSHNEFLLKDKGCVAVQYDIENKPKRATTLDPNTVPPPKKDLKCIISCLPTSYPCLSTRMLEMSLWYWWILRMMSVTSLSLVLFAPFSLSCCIGLREEPAFDLVLSFVSVGRGSQDS
mmetsp:Transcript_29138/g.67555  ORF Transcript_29138/g.67555 Transcript_29138/m.67555 type:complete len:119 (+) Transcript_29138:28-384(+)